MPNVTPLSKTRSRRIAPKEGRVRCARHIAWIRTLRCSVPGCYTKPVEAHHLRTCDDPEALGLKSGDDWTVPLCHTHHVGIEGVQTSINERVWAKFRGIDLEQYARILWAASVKAGRWKDKP